MSDEEVLRLLPIAAASVARRDDRADAQLARLGAYDERDRAQVDRCLQAFLASLVRGAWERGWAPADVVQYGRRELDAGIEPLLLAAISAEHQAYRTDAIDPRWLDQLAEAGVAQPFAALSLTSWAVDARLGRFLVLHHALSLAGFLQTLPIMARLFPLPGTPARGERSAVPANSKMLARIRALLAKAEATEFPDEAEALSGKAQELMAKFSLDSALVEAEQELPDDSAARRLWVDTPYVSAKAQLVGAVAAANRCRTVVIDSLAVVTVVGAELDLQHTEILSTSLLVQANRAMLAAGKQAGRTRSFRQSFLMAYAMRIGERLQATASAAEAAVPETDAQRLLPALSQREERVEALFARLFPNTTSRRTRITNGAGWEAGLTAADQATLDARRQVRR
ncbi:DUF2786 domain-containing protein [Kribbella sp.]|uniref:DUF2786 domain-containing protein n=1 Tax=Kribbella sp. TaxID=1871183 RepID=UPI002D3E45E1|nr:DUF2786 domain-containing protein [Kribbella sp.]HZX05957.1 DUF2786 domain-containing protein [Kribbella sp.]